MSRLCAKNLPKYVNEDRLREFFSQKGEVTDVRLMRTKDGKSRQFGFVGFRTDHEAEEAVKYFHKSFMDTCRITCEIAWKVGDPNIPRPWSRHSIKKNVNTSEVEKRLSESDTKGSKVVALKERNSKSTANDDYGDPKFQEFLQVMQPRNKSKLWADDTPAALSISQNSTALNSKSGMTEGPENSLGLCSDLEKFKRDESNKDFEKRDSDIPNSVVQDKVLSDMDYFRSRIKKDWSDSDGSGDETSVDYARSDGSGGVQNKSSSCIAEVMPEWDITNSPFIEHGLLESASNVLQPINENSEALESSRLFIRNLPYTTTEEELEDQFNKYGTVSKVHLVFDKDSKRSKGFAYVLFALPESAARALKEMDNSVFQGRLLHIMPAKVLSSREQKASTSEKHTSKTFKQQREEERKASEGRGNTQAWNSLFMRPDTVVENIVRKFGVSKTEFLDGESDDLPVRMALGETQVIAETKKALSDAGINVSSLEEFSARRSDGLKRSNHVILVKNLPYSSSESELVNMFGKFGNLDKVILPPTKTLALVVFLEPPEAHAAFKGLAYKRFKEAPLYLEWAPHDILSQTPMADEKIVGGKIDDVKSSLLEQQVVELAEADVDLDRIDQSRTLYVKNLNFKTSDEALKKHFAALMNDGKLLSVKVKKHLKNGKNVSMGFGFIELDNVDAAVNVWRDLQGTVLDGHALILQLCETKKGSMIPKKVDNNRSSTKLIIRNVAFQATEKDLRQLFSSFGELKSLRLPKSFGNHRGFAFVEYVTKQEASNALEALSNTHLYGRHLVLERAKEGESLEELRAKTAAQFVDTSKLSNKRKHSLMSDEGNE